MYMPVTTLYFQNTSWETSIRNTGGNDVQRTSASLRTDERKSPLLPECRECEWLFACNGECPKNRFARTADGEPGLNYLVQDIISSSVTQTPYMDFMKNELMNRRPPANIMEAIRNNAIKP